MKRKQKRNRRTIASRRKFTLDEWLVIPQNRFIECPFTYNYGEDDANDRWLDYGDRIDRWRLACERYGLDELVHDSEWLVRKAVAEMGYAQEILSKDSHSEVREAVARTQKRMRRKLHAQDPISRADAVWAYKWKGKNEDRLIGQIRRKCKKYKINSRLIDFILSVDDWERYSSTHFYSRVYQHYPEDYKQ